MLTWVLHGKKEPKPDYKKNTLIPSFQYLCRHLRAGDLMLKGDGYLQPIPAEQLSPSLIRQLKEITEQTAVKRSIGFRGKTRYRGITIKGQIREIYLGSDDITNLVNANRKESSHED